MYWLWSKCAMNLKRTPMTFKIKLTHNFGPFSITFSLRRLFSAKMTIFCVFCRIGYQEPKYFQSKWPRLFFLVHWNTFLPQSKQNSKFSFFLHFYRSLWRYVESSDPLYGGGGSSELISNFLLSMILYNHSSYFKSGEINSCRLSPLPIRIYISYLTISQRTQLSNNLTSFLAKTIIRNLSIFWKPYVWQKCYAKWCSPPLCSWLPPPPTTTL